MKTTMTTLAALVVLELALVLSCVSVAHADTFGSVPNAFDFEFVTIGNPGNDADTDDGDVAIPGIQNFGSVAETFRIGKFEISEDMIDKANAQSSLSITHDNRGANKPATSISWLEAAQFVNWLNTDSGSTPAYKFSGSTFELWTPGSTSAGTGPRLLPAWPAFRPWTG